MEGDYQSLRQHIARFMGYELHELRDSHSKKVFGHVWCKPFDGKKGSNRAEPPDPLNSSTDAWELLVAMCHDGWKFTIEGMDGAEAEYRIQRNEADYFLYGFGDNAHAESLLSAWESAYIETLTKRKTKEANGHGDTTDSAASEP